jgi:Mor family transcriptional regulator
MDPSFFNIFGARIRRSEGAIIKKIITEQNQKKGKKKFKIRWKSYLNIKGRNYYLSEGRKVEEEGILKVYVYDYETRYCRLANFSLMDDRRL